MKSADQKRPLKVFLCHAHADRDAVRALYTRLTNDGVDAWLDKEKLLGGQNWRMEIRAAVEEADVVVVCHSKEFNKEGFRQREVKWALDAAMEKPEGTIFIIPARLEECKVIKSLSDWHWVDLFESNGYDMLMRALRARANNIGATLQIKRSWLPKITTSLPKKQKPIENKVIEISDEKIINDVDDMPPSPELPDDWEAQWQAALVNNDKEEKAFVETTGVKVNQPSAKKIYKPNITIIIGFIVLVVASILGFPSLLNTPADESVATQTTKEVVLETQTPKSSSTSSISINTKTPIFTLTLTSTPLPTEITDTKGVSMVLVPAGDFLMGSNDGDEDEKPLHKVTLFTFYIDKYEVTNFSYRECVKFGSCTPSQSKGTYSYIDDYYENPNFDNFPVIDITWYQAQVYCEWRNAKLPTEAQWEKAARGNDARMYPWGDSFNTDHFSCQNDTLGICYTTVDPVEVGTYENGISPYGVYNMAGNVWEWVADWYSAEYYENSPTINPLGPNSGIYKVLRGGGFTYSPEGDFRTYNRRKYVPDDFINFAGFRCAKDANP